MNAAAAVAANNAIKASKADTKPSVPLMNGIKIEPTPKKAIIINIKSKLFSLSKLNKSNDYYESILTRHLLGIIL